MMNIAIANRQRTKKINTRFLKQIVSALFTEAEIQEAELGIHIVGAKEMARVNWQFLQHEGSTDVITFDHGDSSIDALNRNLEKFEHMEPAAPPHPNLLPRGGEGASKASQLHGELFICVDDAVAQAKEFHTTWQSEIVRYIVHGVQHLLGHDDLKPDLRRKMKREENRLVRRLSRRFSLAELSRAGKISS
jgi:probable rRNA maturation factor